VQVPTRSPSHLFFHFTKTFMSLSLYNLCPLTLTRPSATRSASSPRPAPAPSSGSASASDPARLPCPDQAQSMTMLSSSPTGLRPSEPIGVPSVAAAAAITASATAPPIQPAHGPSGPPPQLAGGGADLEMCVRRLVTPAAHARQRFRR
jgi:hypothetical protein